MRQRSICILLVMLVILCAQTAWACIPPNNPYNGNWSISDPNCVWNDDVTITGQLVIGYGVALKVATTSSQSPTIQVGSIMVEGTLEVESLNPGKSVSFFMNSGSEIYVQSNGIFTIDTVDNGSLKGSVYFFGESLNSWNGIYGARGSRIVFDGDISSLRKTIFVNNIDSIETAIYHNGGASYSIGKLFVRGTKFTSGYSAIMVDGTATSLQQSYLSDIVISYNDFENIIFPIQLQDLDADRNIYVRYNSVKTHYSTAINFTNVHVSGNIRIGYNTIDMIQAGSYAINMENVRHGEGRYIDAIYNVVTGGHGMIKVDQWRAKSGTNCQLYIKHNTTLFDDAVYGVYVDHGLDESVICETGYLAISDNDFGNTADPHNGSVAAYSRNNPRCDEPVNTCHFVNNNTKLHSLGGGGFYQEYDIDDLSGWEIWGNTTY